MASITERLQGRVPVGVNYKIIDVTYKHKDDVFAFSTCDNCGHIISNIYTIAAEDGKKYDVGSECVVPLTNNALELSEAKRLMAAKKRFLKKLLTETKCITLHKYDGVKVFRFYKFIVNGWNVNAIGMGRYETYRAYIDRLNVPVINCIDTDQREGR